MKPGGQFALDRVEQLLRDRFPGATFVREQGSVGASIRHVTPVDADRIARESQMAVGTTGD